MSKLFILLAMIFCHIIDDYVLQAVSPLSKMKQRRWWRKNYPQKLYRYDYLLALLMHSLSWSFMIMLPIALSQFFEVGVKFLILFIANTVFHGFVDNAKANWRIINLIADQIFHMVQIAVTFCILL